MTLSQNLYSYYVYGTLELFAINLKNNVTVEE